MGTTYQTLLVVGELPQVRSAVAAAGGDGLVMPVGVGRTAVILREGEWGWADVDGIAARLGLPVLTHVVLDSDAVILTEYREGKRLHEYVSDQAVLVDWFVDDDGATKFRVGGVEYPEDAPSPKGPSGADPAVLAPFGTGNVDLERLGACLRGELGLGPFVMAEWQHRMILEALNLDPRCLMTAFRHAAHADLPGAVPIRD
jgi:hypothetical protein